MFYEFTHDSLANAVYEKVSVEEKARRKVERFVKDRHVYYTAQGVLLNQKDLEYVQPYLDRIKLADEEWEFVRKSKVNSRNRRIRLIAAVLVMLLISGLALVALIQRSNAEKARAQAEINRQAAEANAEIASSNEKEAKRQAGLAEKSAERAEFSALQAQNAKIEADRQRMLAETAAAEAELRRQEAEDLAGRLDISRQEAEAAAEREKNARLRAEVLKEKEQIARAVADSLRDLALAQSIALKSLQIDDPSERAAVAQRAYNIHTKRNGSSFDANLYQALYFAQNQEGTVLSGHLGRVRSLAHQTEAKLLMSIGSDGKLIRWPYLLNQKGETLFFSDQLSRALAFDTSPQGPIWVGTENGQVLQIDGQTKTLQSSHSWHQGPIWDLAWDPINARLFSSGGDGFLIVHEGDSLRSDTLMRGQSSLKRLQLMPNGDLLAANDRGEVFWISFAPDRVAKKIISLPHPITAMSLSPDARVLAIGDEQGRVRVWKWANMEKIATLLAHRVRVTDLCFSPNGRLLSSCSWDQTARLWESKDFNTPSIVLSDHDYPAECLTFSSDGSQLFVGLANGDIKRWQTSTDTLFKQLVVNPDTEIPWNTYLGSSSANTSEP